MTYNFHLTPRKNPSVLRINCYLLRSYATSRTIPQKPLHKSASKPIISSFYRGLTPLHLNGRLNAQVESDIVGYTTVTAQPGFTLMALPFNDLASDDGISIQNLVTGDIAANSTIQYWDGTKLNVLTYRVRGGVGSWYKGTATADKKFFPGEGFWFNSKATEDITLTIAGRVEEDAGLAVNKNDVALIGAAVPKTLSLNDISFTGISTGATLQYWDGEKLNVLTYRVRGGVGGWYKGTQTATHTILPATGFWFNANSSDVTITF